MVLLTKGRYRARLSRVPSDVLAAQRLRARAFGLSCDADVEPYDAFCDHVLIEDVNSGELLCCFRMLEVTGGSVSRCYASQYYELSALERFGGKMAELGRFCVAPERTDPDILRIAWAAVTRLVDAGGIELLFGCSSFEGTDVAKYSDAFAMLKARHLGPKRWLPRVKAPDVFRFAARLRRAPDMRKAMRVMPPLLKTYLMMGGWVSDHAVVDRQMNTLHVFTGVEIRAIPAARQRVLRAVMG